MTLWSFPCSVSNLHKCIVTNGKKYPNYANDLNWGIKRDNSQFEPDLKFILKYIRESCMSVFKSVGSPIGTVFHTNVYITQPEQISSRPVFFVTTTRQYN